MIAVIVLLLGLAFHPAVAQVPPGNCGTISSCPSATTPLTGNELVPMVQASKTVMATLQMVFMYVYSAAQGCPLGVICPVVETTIAALRQNKTPWPQINVTSYYGGVGGVGGGTFNRGCPSGITSDNSGTYIFDSESPAQCYSRADAAQPQSVYNFGAVCNDIVDDTAAINAAKAAVVAAGEQGAVIFPPNVNCLVKSGLTVDKAHVALVGNGTVLDFSQLSSGCAITDISSAGYPSPAAVTVMRGIVAVGPGVASSVDGLCFGASPNYPVQNVSYENDAWQQFRHAVNFQGTANVPGLITFLDNTFEANGSNSDSVFYVQSTVAGFENIRIIGGAIIGGKYLIDMEGTSTDLNVIGTSLDGPSAAAVYQTAGDVHLANCHIEISVASAAAQIALIPSNSAAPVPELTIQGCQMQNDATSGTGTMVDLEGTGRVSILGGVVFNADASGLFLKLNSAGAVASVYGADVSIAGTEYDLISGYLTYIQSNPVSGSPGNNSPFFSNAVTFGGAINAASLSGGSPSKYACFDSSGNLVASSTAC